MLALGGGRVDPLDSEESRLSAFRQAHSVASSTVRNPGDGVGRTELCIRTTNNKVTDEQMAELDLSHWKVALCGAEPVHPRTMDDFSTRFARIGFDQRAITPVYGLAEATLAVTFFESDASPSMGEL